MARPIKQGLEYFPLDVDFFQDEKIEAICGEFGIKGELIAIKLLCAVYRNGYFAMWNDLTKMKLLKSMPGVSADLIEQVVLRLVKWGFFNESLFNSDKVLTSNGIQKRYIMATKRRSNNPLSVYVCNNGVNVYNNSPLDVVNVDNNAQSKEKESKVKETTTTIADVDFFAATDFDNTPISELVQRLKSLNYYTAYEQPRFEQFVELCSQETFSRLYVNLMPIAPQITFNTYQRALASFIVHVNAEQGGWKKGYMCLGAKKGDVQRHFINVMRKIGLNGMLSKATQQDLQPYVDFVNSLNPKTEAA